MAQLNLLLLFMALMCSVVTSLPRPSDPPESVPRIEDFVSLTWDSTTANIRLLLSDDNRTATLLPETKTYNIHEYRPQSTQVLCSTPLTGRCYFEVLWNQSVDIALAYQPSNYTHRTETFHPLGRFIRHDYTVFGDNDYSWSLRIYSEQFFVSHNNEQEPVRHVSTDQIGFPAGEIGERRAGAMSGVVGVFLDYDAGILSFYEIMNEGRASHLYTFRENFTQPLFPGFGVWVVYAQSSAGNSGSLLSAPLISP